MNERERVEALRKALGLTQGEFGKRLGLSTSGVSEIENGRRVLQDRHLLLIKAAFPQVNVEWLRTGSGTMMEAEQPSYIDDMIRRLDLPTMVGELYKTYESLPSDGQKAVADFAHRLVSNIVTAAGITGDALEESKQKSSQAEADHQDLMDAIDRELRAERDQEDGSGASQSTGSAAG